jgi:hypothetical protein
MAVAMTMAGRTAEAGAIGPLSYSAPSSGGTDWSNVQLPVALFDDTLGTLESVVISETFTGNIGVTATNVSGGSPSTAGTFVLESDLTIGGPCLLDGCAVLSNSLSGAVPYVLAAGASGTFSTGSTPGSPVVWTYSIPADDLSAWEHSGPATDNLVLNSSTYLSNSAPAGVPINYAPTLDLTVAIQYNYLSASSSTNTPEPATMVTLGAALVGLGVARRRRKLLQRVPSIG